MLENTHEKGFHKELSPADIFGMIGSWFFYFLKKWWIIVPVVILSGLLGIWQAIRDKPKYESRLTFALDDDNGSGGGNVLNLAAQFGVNLGSGTSGFFSGDNILEIMKSRRIVKKVLLSTDTIDHKNERLIQHFLNFSNDSSKTSATPEVKFPVNLTKESFSYKQDSILKITAEWFSSKLIAAGKPDKKLDIYEVNVTTPDEHFSKVFTDRLVQETINFYTELRVKKNKETLAILEERVAAMKGNLNSSIDQRFSIPDANVNPAFSASQAPLQKQTTNMQVYGSAYTELFKNLELTRFQYLKDIPLLQVIDAADYPMKRIKKGKLKTGLTYSVIGFTLVLVLLVVYRKYRQYRATVIVRQPSS